MPKQPGANDITGRDEIGTSSIDYGRAVAAATCDWRPRESVLLFVANVLPQIRREPFFHCGQVFASPGRVINCLIASDLPDSEIF